MKKSRFLLTVISLVLLGMLTTNPAFGGKKKPSTPPQHEPPVISSVTPTSITVTENKVSKTLTVTQFTEITVNGQRAMASDLKPGMRVSVTLGTDPTRAGRINATGK